MSKDLKPLKWETEKRKISDLIKFDYNPRILSKEQEKKLTESLKNFGLVEIPAIDTDGTILAGHQRLKCYEKINGDSVIDVRVPNRQLTRKEREEYLIRSNKNTGSWDFEMLSEEFNSDDLLDWGFGPDDFTLEIDSKDEEKEKDEPEEVFTEEFMESHNYVILYFDNDLDWLSAEEKLGIKSVHAKASKPGTKYELKGRGRVLNGADVISRMSE